MGQKTPPIGLHVGIHSKWASSWYDSNTTTSLPYTNIFKESFISKGIINSRGGTFASGVESFVANYLIRFSFSNISKSRRYLPVSFHLFKAYGGYIYGFIFYTKLITLRLI